MTLPTYPAYRPSGHDALGQIPAHWTAMLLKRDLAFLTSGSRGWAEHYSESGDIFIRIANLTRDSTRLDLEDAQFVIVPAGVEGERTKVQAGDVLFSITAYLGSVAVVPDGIGDAYVSQHLALARLRRSKLLPAWLAYFALSGAGERSLEAAGYGGTKVQLGLEDIANLVLPVPPLEEQKVAVAFLDRETAKIDALIAEQEKLIALLAEKRQATISQSVAQGLDSELPLKDSGVKWLGEVPAHWTVGKIQSFARRESGHTPSRQHPEYWENCTIPWFSLADVWQIRDGRQKHVFVTSEKVSELGIANSSARILPAGTVILSRTASVGYSAIMGCDMATTQDFVNWVCGPALNPEFLLYVLRGMRSEFDRLMMGSTHQTIYMPDVAKLMMALPPLDEQAKIVAYLDRATGQIDALRDDADRAIALLRERRSALISAAVTGQIDVRNAVPA